jgi:hypothetical protein
LLIAALSSTATAQFGGGLGGAASSQKVAAMGPADSLFASGRIGAAESLYYATSSANPRDAAARAALGRFLAARGAHRIGAVLLEEARLFGGDTAAIARALVPVYRGLGDYRALASLPRSPLSRADHARAVWLVAHPQVLEIADTLVQVPYRAVNDGTGLGVVELGIGERRLEALIDPNVNGVRILAREARKRGGVKAFGDDAEGVVAVVPELHVGDVVLSNIPARLDTSAAPLRIKSDSGSTSEVRVRLGLDVLRRLAPSFDPAAGTMQLRRTGQLGKVQPGTRVPIWFDDSGMRVLVEGHWQPTTSAETGKLLGTRSWTLDARRGEMILTP